jgi:hypothetical protein
MKKGRIVRYDRESDDNLPVAPAIALRTCKHLVAAPCESGWNPG